MHARHLIVVALLVAFANRSAADEPKTDKIETIYKALELTDPEIEGKGPFKVGDIIKFNYGLKNMRSQELRAPEVQFGDQKLRIVGGIQKWIERLGKDTNIVDPRLVNAARDRAKYAAGSSVIPVPEVIKGLASLPLASILGADPGFDTKSYSPGKYKITIEYWDVGLKVLQSKSVEFELTGMAEKELPKKKGETAEPNTDKIEMIYKALELTTPKVDGKAPFMVGDVIKISCSLRNKTSQVLRTPKVSELFRDKRLVGGNQAWIERLGMNTDIPGQGRVARNGAKYSVGEAIIEVPEVIKRLEPNLLGEGWNKREFDTKDFLPGKYKFTIEYQDVNDKVLQSKSVEFELKAAPKKAPTKK